MSGVELISIDKLEAMDEEELRRRLRNIKRIMRRCSDNHKRMQFETEYCYIYREIEVREQRRAVHLEWISNERQKRGVA